MTHTLGPWEAAFSTIWSWGIRTAKGVLAKGIRRKADANLIAAAPDLLDACKELLDLATWASGAPVFNLGGDAREGWLKVCGAIDEGYAAIAKAKGRPPKEVTDE